MDIILYTILTIAFVAIALLGLSRAYNDDRTDMEHTFGSMTPSDHAKIFDDLEKKIERERKGVEKMREDRDSQTGDGK